MQSIRLKSLATMALAAIGLLGVGAFALMSPASGSLGAAASAEYW